MKRISKNRSVRLALFLVLIALFLIGVPLLVSNYQSQRSVAGDHGGPLAGEAIVSDLLGLGVVEAQSHTFNLCASDGTINMPDSTSVSVWGFVDTMGGTCTPGLVTSLPGPTLDGITDGDSVTINLSNALAVPTSILIPGQGGISATGGVAGTFTTEAPAGGTVSYSFTAQTGTYLYESGTDPSIQIPMGLYGALIVDSATAGRAYTGVETAYDVEAVLLLSEIDPVLNSDPAGFDLNDYHPTYWLINGKAFNATDTISAVAGQRVLLRYLNAGFLHPSMSVLGGYQRVVAKEAFELTNPFDAVAETIPAGTTADMIIDTSGLSGSLALFNRNMRITNADAFPGGMMTFINIQ